jgi:hypothetical protein
MPTLLELQRDVARDLLEPSGSPSSSAILGGGLTTAERLSIYRNTYRWTLTGALRATYPAIETVVGGDFFDGAAAFFIEAHPPRSAYLNGYGAEFANFLAGFEPASSLAYLPDLARLEWAVSQAANAADCPAFGPASLAAIEEEKRDALRLAPHPSAHLISLRWPADDIWRAVRAGTDEALAALNTTERPRRVLVWRGSESVTIRALTESEAVFTDALLAGARLGDTLSPDPDLVSLLGLYLATGLFSAATFDMPKQSTEG